MDRRDGATNTDRDWATSAIAMTRGLLPGFRPQGRAGDRSGGQGGGPVVGSGRVAPRHELLHRRAPRARLARRRENAFAIVFLRDWHPVLRDLLDLLSLSFPVGGVIFALQGDWDGAVRLFMPGLAVFAVRAIDVPRPVDWVF